MHLKTIKLLRGRLSGKRVLVRCDFNVTLNKKNRVSSKEDQRMKLALPTIKFLLKEKAIVIILAHLGRPSAFAPSFAKATVGKKATTDKDGKIVNSLRLNPLAKRLGTLLKKEVYKLDEIVGRKVKRRIQSAKPGDVVMLENLRFDPREEKDDPEFAKQLAELGDYYINEAFSNSHRKHASMDAITKYLPSYAGLLLEKEYYNLHNTLVNPKKPLCVVIGGAKISTKIGLIKKFLKIADNVLLGGALVNTVLKAKGISIGKSYIEKNIANAIESIEITNHKLHLPTDVIIAKDLSNNAKTSIKAVGQIEKDDYILDIGPDTIYLFNAVINKSKTIIWNGPMGMIEKKQCQEGTRSIYKNLLKSKARIIIGGGDTLKIVDISKEKIPKNIFTSSGGGAMLEFLEKGMLVGIKPLLNN